MSRPKYQRLADALIESIRLGKWRPGDRLPAEEELVQATPYSLGTVQKALRILTDQGLVVRRHGLGSFVADPGRELQDPWHCRFLADDNESILPIYSRAVQCLELSDPGPWNRYLGNDAVVMRLDRVISVNEEFKIFSRFYGDKHLLRPLWEMSLDDLHGANFKKLITQYCKLPITDITHFVTTRAFEADICEQVAVPPGTTGMFMYAVARAGTDLCVYYQDFFIAPNTRLLKFPEMTVSKH